MVPANIQPQPILKAVEQPEFEPSMVSDDKTSRPARGKKETKPKKDPKRNMPEGGNIIEGFRKASTLAKRKRGSSSDLESPPENETHSQRVHRLLTISDKELEEQFANEDLALSLRPPKPRTRAGRTRILSSPSISPPSSPPHPFGKQVGACPTRLRSRCRMASRRRPFPSSSSSSRPLAAVVQLGVARRWV